MFPAYLLHNTQLRCYQETKLLDNYTAYINNCIGYFKNKIFAQRKEFPIVITNNFKSENIPLN